MKKKKRRCNQHINLILSKLKQHGCAICRHNSMWKYADSSRPLRYRMDDVIGYRCDYTKKYIKRDAHESCGGFQVNPVFGFNQTFTWSVSTGVII